MVTRDKAQMLAAESVNLHLMFGRISHCIMRTTLNIDTPILRELKRLQAEEGKPLGKLVSELLLFALNLRKMNSPQKMPALEWIPIRMNARIDASSIRSVRVFDRHLPPSRHRNSDRSYQEMTGKTSCDGYEEE